ncbi:MAG: PilZ domain-containing protein [Desulfobacterales bacterium]
MPNNDNDQIAADVLARLQKVILELSHDHRKSLLQQAEDLLADEPEDIQRSSNRKEYSTYVNFFLNDDSHWGLSRDISKSGMFIETYELFSINQEIKIFLPNPDNTKIIEVPAKIARATPDGIGVVFMM